MKLCLPSYCIVATLFWERKQRMAFSGRELRHLCCIYVVLNLISSIAGKDRRKISRGVAKEDNERRIGKRILSIQCHN